MRERRGLCVLAGTLVLLSLGVLGQTSSSYQNSEHVVNSGGNPAPVLISSGYQITLSSLGDGLCPSGLSSDNFSVDGGFTGAYPPPGEVLDLRFTGKTSLEWAPEASVGTYNVYRGTSLTLLPAGNYGTCLAEGLTEPLTTDTALPGAGQCFFYLVTAENRLAEEGTLGETSGGTQRPNTAPCS